MAVGFKFLQGNNYQMYNFFKKIQSFWTAKESESPQYILVHGKSSKNFKYKIQQI